MGLNKPFRLNVVLVLELFAGGAAASGAVGGEASGTWAGGGVAGTGTGGASGTATDSISLFFLILPAEQTRPVRKLPVEGRW